MLLLLPLYVDEFWLRTGFAVFGAIIGALGLNLLVGTTGQLSLAHAFFLAVGAMTYTYVVRAAGWHRQPLRAAWAGRRWSAWSWACCRRARAVCSSARSPRDCAGIYLGVASLGLVFIGQHVLNTWTIGHRWLQRPARPRRSRSSGSSFAGDNSPYLVVLDVPFGQAERLWYLGLVLCCGRLLVRLAT